MRIESINVGRPRDVIWRDRPVRTAIFKYPVPGPVAVRRLGLEGDGQADPSVHGGEDKAVYAYASSHYARWISELPGLDLPAGAFGENLTLDDFSEGLIRAGDTFRVGTAVLVVSQPRLPCYKLNLRHGRVDMIDRMLANGLTGFYLRVEEEGEIDTGMEFELIDRQDNAISIADAARLYTGALDDPGLLRRAIASAALPAAWRERLQRKLDARATGAAGSRQAG